MHESYQFKNSGEPDNLQPPWTTYHTQVSIIAELDSQSPIVTKLVTTVATPSCLRCDRCRHSNEDKSITGVVKNENKL